MYVFWSGKLFVHTRECDVAAVYFPNWEYTKNNIWSSAVSVDQKVVFTHPFLVSISITSIKLFELRVMNNGKHLLWYRSIPLNRQSSMALLDNTHTQSVETNKNSCLGIYVKGMDVLCQKWRIKDVQSIDIAYFAQDVIALDDNDSLYDVDAVNEPHHAR